MTVLFPDSEVPPRWRTLANGLTLASLGLLVWGVVTGIPGVDSRDQKLAAVLLLAAASLGWVAWVLLRNTSPEPAVATCLVVVAVAGGALAAFAPVALVFPGVAALAAASRWPMPAAVAVGGAGWLAALIAVEANGNKFDVILAALAAVLAGLMVGLTRRQAVEHAEQVTRLELASERGEVERTRAELLAERNHLARELHDVLAHTLAALSLQLEAFATIVDAEPTASPAIREQLDQTRKLVREGLDEARGAVSALRDDAAPLPERLAKLSEQHGAAFSVSGLERPLAPEGVLALYRAAQEALTNVMKHATGASASVRLSYDDAGVSVTVDNEGGATNGRIGPLGSSGGGYGLRGIGERLALLGGQVEAGPTPEGWRVRATVPTGAAPRQPQSQDPLAS